MSTIFVKRGLQSELTGGVLGSGELGYTTDFHNLYAGDGSVNYFIGRTIAGTFAAMPASASANTGKLYFATDTERLYRDNGTTWDLILSNDLDDLTDGTYAKVLASEVSSGQVTRLDDGTYDVSAQELSNHVGTVGSAAAELGKHRLINDSGTSTTELWSADKIAEHIDSKIQGLTWREAVIDILDFSDSEPAAPTLGDRYINTYTGSSNVTAQTVAAMDILEWNSSDWTEITPTEGWATYVLDLNVQYNFNDSGAWVSFGSTTTHNATSGKQGGTADEYYHLTAAQHGAIGSGFTSWTLKGDGATTYPITDGDTANFVGGTGISTDVNGDDILTITNDSPNIQSDLAAGTRTTTSFPITNTDGSGVTVPAATTSLAGLMTDAQFDKLDGIAAGADVNVNTNLSLGTRTATTMPVNSSTGDNVALLAATTSLAGLMTDVQFDKLAGIAVGADVTSANETSHANLTKDNVAETITANWTIADNSLLYFGTNSDFHIRYDEAGSDKLNVSADSTLDKTIIFDNINTGSIVLDVTGSLNVNSSPVITQSEIPNLNGFVTTSGTGSYSIDDTTYEVADSTIIREADIDDTPVDGVTDAPISSNWAYDHINAGNPHGVTENVSTTLDHGTITATTYGITTDGSANDIILPEATTSTAGLLGADKWDEIVANSLKNTNVSTNLTTTHNADTVVVTSSDGTNATINEAVGGVTAGIISEGLKDSLDILTSGNDSQNLHTHDPIEIAIADAGSIITATDVEGALQENRTAIDLNTAKATNVSTSLTLGTRTATTIPINSDGSSPDITLPAATTSLAGLMTDAQFDKLEGITAGANNYSHPGHPGDDISVDTTALTGATVVSDIDFNITTDTVGHVTDATLTTLATRELTPSDIGVTGLESLTETTTGWRLIGRPAANFGNIGDGAVDFSRSISTSTTRGATGQFSFAANAENTALAISSTVFGFENSTTTDATESFVCGWENTANSVASFVTGRSSSTNGLYAMAAGFNCEANGDYSAALGQGAEVVLANDFGCVALGKYNSGLTSTVLEVGIGASDGARVNAFEVYQNGTVKLPDAVDSAGYGLIDTLGDGAVVTLGWVGQATIDGGTFV